MTVSGELWPKSSIFNQGLIQGRMPKADGEQLFDLWKFATANSGTSGTIHTKCQSTGRWFMLAFPISPSEVDIQAPVERRIETAQISLSLCPWPQRHMRSG